MPDKCHQPPLMLIYIKTQRAKTDGQTLDSRIYITRFAFSFLKAMASYLSMTLGLLFLCMLAGVHGGQLRVWNLHAKNLEGDLERSQADGYVKISWGGQNGGMTNFNMNNANPSWTAKFILEEETNSPSSLKLEVWDKDLKHDDHLGTCIVEVMSGTHNKQCDIGSKGSLLFNYSYSP
ncbi:hypothetical protein DPEC_G00013880 [Dallia pectoralis]|uniref:Uncharacterized protein n=1 Tax=Dallia pectoralis TaxID=75939 RepID=A0ACC2HNJ8_DALPE|nr:hypothetical protein DPEC_G00013880 [Dallia pectoralis]